MSSSGAVHLHERNTDENEMDYESSNNHEDSGEGMVFYVSDSFTYSVSVQFRRYH